MTSHDNVTDIEKRLRNFALNTLALIPDKLQQYPKTDPDLIIKGFSHQCDLLTEAADTIATLRKQLANAREALRPFALAAQKGSNVYAGVQMAMKDRPDLFSYSTAYIDAGRSTAHSHLSWSDYVEAREAYEALKGQPC